MHLTPVQHLGANWHFLAKISLCLYFWWLVTVTLVVAFGFLPQHFGRWQGPTNCHFAQKKM